MSDNYLTNLVNTVDSHEYQMESMENQIQLMFQYIDSLEEVKKELQCMLHKYHDDDCTVCDRAYMVDDAATYRRNIFYSCAGTGMAKGDWIVQRIDKQNNKGK